MRFSTNITASDKVNISENKINENVDNDLANKISEVEKNENIIDVRD